MSSKNKIYAGDFACQYLIIIKSQIGKNDNHVSVFIFSQNLYHLLSGFQWRFDLEIKLGAVKFIITRSIGRKPENADTETIQRDNLISCKGASVAVLGSYVGGYE